jgi:antitoxin component YwqK of YwqJK toxin-antitoxin module
MRVSLELLEYDDDVRTLDGKPFTGIGFDVYPDGQLRSEVPYIEGFAEGIYREWHPNGVLKEEWQACHGCAEGIVKTWHDNGVIRSEEEVQFGAELAFDEWDREGRHIASRRIDEKSELFKYLLVMRSRTAKS